ncbi:MAG TPA: peptidoglycan-associated lipoprotein Pal [Terriglobales bacterium]
MRQLIRNFMLGAVAVGVIGLGACSKKIAKVVTPPPPPPATPSATLSANPSVVEPGQSTQLTWKTSNAETISIEGIGDVAATGSQTVTPTASTTYTLTAKGPGGTLDASARVTVNAKNAKAPASLSEEELFTRNVKDVYFDYNKSNLRPDQGVAADSDAAFLKQHPGLKVLIEGHCDDRGSEEYNLALGDTRANSLRQALLTQGVSADQIKTISYGKEHPFCSESNEGCWQQNRRDHFALQR